MPLSSKGYRPVSSWWSLGIIACNQVHRCEFWGPQKPPERGSSDETWRRWRTIAIIVAPVAEFPGMLPSHLAEMDRRTLASYVEIVLEAHVEAKKKQQAAMTSTAKDIAWTRDNAAAVLMAVICFITNWVPASISSGHSRLVDLGGNSLHA